MAAIILAKRQGEYIIDGIAVDSSLRGTGIGAGLLSMAISLVEELGGTGIYLVARAPEFFGKYGFVAVRREAAPMFFECMTCPQYGVTCHPEVMYREVSQ